MERVDALPARHSETDEVDAVEVVLAKPVDERLRAGTSEEEGVVALPDRFKTPVLRVEVRGLHHAFAAHDNAAEPVNAARLNHGTSTINI